MKLIDFSIAFICFAATVCIGLDIRTGMAGETIKTDINLNQVVDRAVQDTLEGAWIELNSDLEICADRDKIIEDLHENLFLGLNAENDSVRMERIKECIPAVILTEDDGYYIYQYRELEDEGESLLEPGFSQKQYFIYEEPGWRVKFRFSDRITLEKTDTGETYELGIGQAKEITGLYMFSSAEAFENKRRAVIIDNIRAALEEGINGSRRAVEAGVRYRVAFPYIKYEEWYQTVDRVSLMAFFMGRPVGMEGRKYQYFVFSGARLVNYHEE